VKSVRHELRNRWKRVRRAPLDEVLLVRRFSKAPRDCSSMPPAVLGRSMIPGGGVNMAVLHSTF
tara:strand:+ start:97 stop:288 length:192 start_codon:yes stop_codon:yes gene_type:complete